MPYRFELIHGDTGLCRIGEGVLTGHEIIQAIRALPVEIAEPDRITHALVDLTAVTRIAVTNAEPDSIARIEQAHGERFGIQRVAIVVNLDLAFGLARMYEAGMSRTGWEIRVLRDLPAAEAWLAEGLLGG